jgi:hypothetical protein
MNVEGSTRYHDVPEEFNEPGTEDPSSPGNVTRPERIPGFMSYATMLGLLAIAIATAAGHHAFYDYLDGREVNHVSLSQSWVIRIGTAFAFLFKASLVPAVGVAFCQGFWYAVRRNPIRVAGLDAMFGVLQNPFKFMNRDLVWRTKRLFFLALICWLLPIAAIFAPGALTGPTSYRKADFSCIPTYHNERQQICPSARPT